MRLCACAPMQHIVTVIDFLGGWQVVTLAIGSFVTAILLHKAQETNRYRVEEKLRQVESNLESTRIRLQSALEQGRHVHKVQFEKEFLIYDEIWRKLVILRAATLDLRPGLQFIDPKESDEQRTERKRVGFNQAFREFAAAVNLNEPFYNTEVRASLDQILTICADEGTDYWCGVERARRGDFSDDYWDKAEKNRQAVIQRVSDARDAIQRRFKQLKVD